MKLGLICRPFSFHGGIETATAGLLERAPARRATRSSCSALAASPTCRACRVRAAAGPAPCPPRCGSSRSRSPPSARRRAGGYDLVQSHERALAPGRLPRGRGMPSRVPGRDGAPAGVDPYHRLVAALERRIFRLRAARHVVAISRQRQGRDRARCTAPRRRRVTLVYNGVDLERFHPDNRARHRRRTREASASRTRRGRCSSSDRASSARGWARCSRARARWPIAEPPARGGRQGRRRGPTGDLARAAGRRRPRGLDWAQAGRGAPLRGGRRRSRCPRATSRSATCTSRRSPPECPVLTQRARRRRRGDRAGDNGCGGRAEVAAQPIARGLAAAARRADRRLRRAAPRGRRALHRTRRRRGPSPASSALRRDAAAGSQTLDFH